MVTERTKKSILRKRKKDIVKKAMLSGWTAVDILKYATIEYDKKKESVFAKINDVEDMMEEVRDDWSKKSAPDVKDAIISLNKTIDIFDMQLYRLNKMLNEETGRGSGSETRRINIEKRISQVALAKHNLIQDTVAAGQKKQPAVKVAEKSVPEKAGSAKATK